MPKTIKLHFVERASEGDTDAQISAMRGVFELVSAEDCDVIYCASVSKVNEALLIREKFKKPLVVYCWDYYKWTHEGKNRGYFWGKYIELMGMANIVLVPSRGQQKRLKELLNIDSIVCECSFTSYKHPVTDGNYVLDPVRDYPEENLGWVEKACSELNIPYVHSEHKHTQAEFRELVINCTFMTCGYREASTGGLTLMEGLYNGKVSLVSDSPYMGASDYLGELGYYFKYDDFEDLKNQIKHLWKERPIVKIEKARKHLSRFTHEAFAKRLLKEISKCVPKKN